MYPALETRLEPMRHPLRRLGPGRAVALAATIALTPLAATGAAAQETAPPASAAPIPQRKPAPPPEPGRNPPAPLAAPSDPRLGRQPVPPSVAGMRPPGATNPGRSPELPALAIPAPPPASVDPSVPGGPGAPATAARPAPDAPPPLGGVPALPGAGQVAVVPPPDPGPGRGVAALGGSEYRLVFDGAASDLRPTDREVLTGLAARLAREQSARLRVSAYAGGATGEEREARRLSLSRALAVREYLIGQGIRATRIDVRALGAAAQGGPSDRVDLVVVN